MGKLTKKTYDPSDPIFSQGWTTMLGGLKGTSKKPTNNTPQPNSPSTEPSDVTDAQPAAPAPIADLTDQPDK